MNYIVISKSEGLYDGAELIKKEAVRQGKYCEIIDITELKNLTKIEKSSLFYFLTNDRLLPSAIKMLRDKGVQIHIINENLLSKNYSKIFIQHTIKENGIEIPKSMTLEATKESLDLCFPIYLKSQRHASGVKKISDLQMYNDINIDQIKYKNFYIEESVEQPDLVLSKIYHIRGDIIDHSESCPYEKFPLSFIETMNQISECLALPVFSADIFIDWVRGKYICIDINPAAAFFKSHKSRSIFVKNILI